MAYFEGEEKAREHALGRLLLGARRGRDRRGQGARRPWARAVRLRRADPMAIAVATTVAVDGGRPRRRRPHTLPGPVAGPEPPTTSSPHSRLSPQTLVTAPATDTFSGRDQLELLPGPRTPPETRTRRTTPDQGPGTTEAKDRRPPRRRGAAARRRTRSTKPRPTIPADPCSDGSIDSGGSVDTATRFEPSKEVDVLLAGPGGGGGARRPHRQRQGRRGAALRRPRRPRGRSVHHHRQGRTPGRRAGATLTVGRRPAPRSGFSRAPSSVVARRRRGGR